MSERKQLSRGPAPFISVPHTKTGVCHTGPSVLLMQGIPGDVVRKITGHRSSELERYQHLSPLFRAQTVDLIAQVLFGGTPADVRRIPRRPARRCSSE